MTDTITSQNIDLSSWDTLYIYIYIYKGSRLTKSQWRLGYGLCSEMWFDSQQEQEVSLFSKASRPTVGPSQPSIERVLEALSPRTKRSPPSNPEVQNKSSYTSTSSYDKYFVCYTFVGRDIGVSIATRYGMNGPGIESRWWRKFPYPSKPVLGPTQPPKQCVLGRYRGG